MSASEAAKESSGHDHLASDQGSHSGMWPMMLAALGIVYGDIGTSPLYALRECFTGTHAIQISEGNVLGILSLVFWIFVFVVSIKYMVFVLRADNRGEGGILALTALVCPSKRIAESSFLLFGLGIFG